MYAWEAIEQSLTFIEEHLTEEICTEESGKYRWPVPFLLSAFVQAAGK